MQANGHNIRTYQSLFLARRLQHHRVSRGSDHQPGIITTLRLPNSPRSLRNHGPAALGQLVEDVTGQPLDRCFRERIFEPLGMADIDLLRSEQVKARLADRQGWRIVLVGDPRQFSAVGRGGMFGHLVDMYGGVELDQVHRFHHHWERQASLRLRAGNPGALAEYEKRGRLHGGTFEEIESEVITAWEQACRRGDTVALMANSADIVIQLNRLAQHTRIMLGELDGDAPSMRAGEEWMLVGDEVVTRRNDRRLRTDRGLMVKNRDHWTITDIHLDGGVTLDGPTGMIRLPAEYAVEHLELGYAQTSHATQGRTVDTALLLVDTPADSRGVYTPMTRGRESNHAYVVVDDNQTALDVLTQAIGRDWIDQPAVARRAQLDPRSRLRPDPGDEDRHAKLERRILDSIEQHRTRTRETERDAARNRGRGPEFAGGR